MSGKWPRVLCGQRNKPLGHSRPPPLCPSPSGASLPLSLSLDTSLFCWLPSFWPPAYAQSSPTPICTLRPQVTLSSGSRLSVQSTNRMMHVVFTSGNVSRKVSRVVSPLACTGGFRMLDGKLGIQEVNSSWRCSRGGVLGQRAPGVSRV